MSDTSLLAPKMVLVLAETQNFCKNHPLHLPNVQCDATVHTGGNSTLLQFPSLFGVTPNALVTHA